MAFAILTLLARQILLCMSGGQVGSCILWGHIKSQESANARRFLHKFCSVLGGALASSASKLIMLDTVAYWVHLPQPVVASTSAGRLPCCATAGSHTAFTASERVLWRLGVCFVMALQGIRCG